MYFETKVKYDKMHENGTVKAVTEPYLVDALTCTEAEARITKELGPYISGGFSVTSVKQTKLADIIFDSGMSDYFYLVKISFPTLDEKTATEKPTISSILVQARDFNSAKLAVESHMAQSMADWEFVSIALTPIVDVFQYEAPAEDVRQSDAC